MQRHFYKYQISVTFLYSFTRLATEECPLSAVCCYSLFLHSPALMPPDKTDDYDSHLRRSIQELQDINDDVNISVCFVFSKRNIPDEAQRQELVDPQNIMADLRTEGFLVYVLVFCIQSIIYIYPEHHGRPAQWGIPGVCTSILYSVHYIYTQNIMADLRSEGFLVYVPVFCIQSIIYIPRTSWPTSAVRDSWCMY